MPVPLLALLVILLGALCVGQVLDWVVLRQVVGIGLLLVHLRLKDVVGLGAVPSLRQRDVVWLGEDVLRLHSLVVAEALLLALTALVRLGGVALAAQRNVRAGNEQCHGMEGLDRRGDHRSDMGRCLALSE